METKEKNIASDYSVSYIAEVPKKRGGDAILSDSANCLDLGFYQGAVWERRRYEVATAAMQGMIACGCGWEEE